MDLQTHTHRQVQMHMTAKIVAEKLASKAKNSKVFTRHFSDDTTYFVPLDNKPIVVEKFEDGKFTKYVNNDGNPFQKLFGKSPLFEQAEALLSFSYEKSNKKFLLIDLQRGGL